MKLFRIDTKAHDAYDGSYTGGLPDPISFLIDDGALVPVEVEATIEWCFAHHMEQFSACIYRNSGRGLCDIGDAVIVRAEA